jgi:hypothetical protein
MEPDRVEFEFDPAKSASNLEKHGIDFGAVQAIWTSLRSVGALEQRRVNVDFPSWMIESLDRQAPGAIAPDRPLRPDRLTFCGRTG